MPVSGRAGAAGDDDEDALAFWRVSQVYNNVLKLGAIEDQKNKDKIAALVRFPTNQKNETSLDEYVENRKKGQKQVRPLMCPSRWVYANGK